MMACCFPGASSPMPLLHYTSHCMGPCAAGPLCPYNSKIAKGSFAIAVRAGGAGALQAGAAQGNLTAFCSPECFVESCKSVASEDAASLLPWKYSTVFTWQRQQWEQRQQLAQRQLLDAPCCSSAGRITSAKVAASSASGSVGPHSTISRALPFLNKRKDPPKTEAEPPPSKRMSFDELNNSAAAAESAARLQSPPPKEVAVAAGAEAPGGAKPIPVTLSTQKRFKYMHDLLLAKTTQSWPVTDKERDQHGFAPPAIKKQLLWWVRDDGLGQGGGILLAAAWFDTLMGLEREGWDRSDARLPPGPAAAPR